MIITRRLLASKLTDYLYHRITLSELVDWAEDAFAEAELDSTDFSVIREILARLGVADVRSFGLTWTDCENMLGQLGYRVQLEVMTA